MCLLRYVIGLAALTAPLWAGEYVVLNTGFRIHADRHEIDGSTARIFSEGAMVEMPLGAVAGFEQEEKAPSPSPLPVVQPAPAPVKMPDTPAEMASQAARKYLLPDSFLRSVMKAESAFHPDALSPKGAIGLMQLMPETARQLGVDPRDPRQNADGGAQYLRELLARYENDPNQVLLALAAYNAGPAAVEHWHGVPPYRETREYILRVLSDWEKEQKQPAK